MKTASVIIIALAWFSATAAFPSLPIQESARRSISYRGNPPAIPERPTSSGPNSFHGSQFEFLEQTGYAPAVDAMPVFLYSRTTRTFEPCYPESAIQHHDKKDPPDAPLKPNKGTHVPIGADPGDDCKDPGPYHGAYSPGIPFPVYVTAMYCDNTDEWKVNYDLYYVHDGVLSFMGHRHDWEGVTVVWRRDAEGDWWHRAGAIYNVHNYRNWYSWDSLRTVDGDTPEGSDVRDDEPGTNKKHPKVYVGFFSHGAFPDKDDRSRMTVFNVAENIAKAKETLMDEYRSDDWWRLPQLADIHSGHEIPIDWQYGHATSTPLVNKYGMCTWEY